MKIIDVVCSKGRTGFYFDDQRAIKKGAGHDGVFYVGETVTEGFTSIRQAGESISVMLILEDGQIAYGDCAAVQYSGAGGRDPLFLARDFIPLIDRYIKPQLIGKEADNFRKLAADMEAIQIDGKRLHTAIRYGVSQALLDAVAKATGRLMCEVVADEYGCTVSDKPIPIFTQSGDDRYDNSDKMIIKGAAVLPHALINNVETKLGTHGEKLADYVVWLRNRILEHRSNENYNPVLHIDCYGTIGQIFGNNNYKKMADYIEQLGKLAKPFHLRIEGPMDCDCDRETQIEALAGLTAEIDRRGCDVELVADEWCNTLEDIKLFADAQGRPYGADQDPRSGRREQHHRSRALLRKEGHRRLSGRHLQRNRPQRASLRALRDGHQARADSGQARHGRGRRLHDRVQRNGAHPCPARRKEARLITASI